MDPSTYVVLCVIVIVAYEECLRRFSPEKYRQHKEEQAKRFQFLGKVAWHLGKPAAKHAIRKFFKW